ncbi:MAG: PH domain-containing protein [Pyrinomonadaceae bacterium]
MLEPGGSTPASTFRPHADERLGSTEPTRHEDEEKEIFSISPTLMFVKIGYLGAAVLAVVLVAVVAGSTALPPWIAVVIGLLMLLVPAFYHVKQRLVRYRLTESQLEVDEGLISRTTRSVPIRRIQDVTVSASITQRLLGFGDMMIDNASDEGGKLVLRNINSPKRYADELLKQMRRLER